ncbi:MAG: hypothetical protein QGH34_03330 [Candidatus Woesearchaeota archaeon]|nr:hypothetical protein [Candidatus Woesearchaeota archaeon]
MFVVITLPDKIKKNFSKVKIKKTTIKVPRLNARRKILKKQLRKNKISTSTIVKILIKSAIEDAKKEKDEKLTTKDDKNYTIPKEKHVNQGGYGTVSKTYGVVFSSYVSYAKLFSYLGKFKAKNPYQNIEFDNFQNSDRMLLDDNKFNLIEKETMDKGAKHIKYFHPKNVDIDTTSLVPIAGMSSGEWEQFKLWMKLDPVMYLLKTTIS